MACITLVGQSVPVAGPFTRVWNRVPVVPARAALGALIALAVAMSGAPAAAETTVSLSFDDGWADQLAARQILADQGLHGTFFIIGGRVGEPGYMTWGDVSSISADGNEIGGHTLSHRDLTTLTPDEQRDEICDARQDLLARGFPQLSFAYPHGHHDPTSEGLVQGCGYVSGRGIGGLTQSWAEPLPPLNRWVIRTRDSVDATDTVGTLEGWVLDAESVGGGWLNLVFHHICDPNTDPACPSAHMTPSDFSTFLDWLRPRELTGTQIRTIGEVSTANLQPLFSFRALHSRRNGTAKLTFYAGRSGLLQVAEARGSAAAKRESIIRPVLTQVTHAGKVTVILRPSRTGKRILSKRGRLRMPATATFTPFRDTSVSQSLTVRLKARASRGIARPR
jgi:peptidoglycan/xylan/chitin deacetylase (PgdA/CDA1 family)